MSKIKTLRQSAAVSNEILVERLASQIETVRQAKHQSAEDLALTLEPLAQALAALTDETRQTLIEIDRKSREQGEKFTLQLTESVNGYKEAAAEATKAAESLDRAGNRMEWRHYALTVMTGLFTAALASAFWLWLNPPTIQYSLDAEAVAEHLKPAVIEALKRSKNK